MIRSIVFIIRFRIKQDGSNDFRKHYRVSIPPVEANKPGTLVQLAYENENATEVSVVRLFSSADAMDLHLQGANERTKKTFEFIEPISIQIFGIPNAATIETLKKLGGPGIVVNVNPQFIGGFVR